MSKTALYRKYRSRSLENLVGQDHITKTLANALEKDAVSHAYLFTGPRGVGKTSTARLIAHAVNGLDYSESNSMPIDIIEIDAASNRRIDEIRELRDTIHIAPTELKYKVYIIDEVHMLTNEAFNALLKTLEEPPTHAIFILATTEAHKLPATIVSRTQQFVFRPIDPKDMVKHLAYIATEEGIDIDPGALTIIAEHSDGSFRDAISLLDQLSQAESGHITTSTVQDLVGVMDDHALTIIDQSISEGDVKTLLNTVQKLIQEGSSAANIAIQYATYLRNLIKEDSKPESQQLATIGVIQELLRVPRSDHQQLLLEITLSKAAVTPIWGGSTTASGKADHKEPKKQPTNKQPAQADNGQDSSKQHNGNNQEPNSSGSNIEQTQNWDDVLQHAQSTMPALYAVLRQATTNQSDKTLSVEFRYALHLRKAKRDNYFQALNDIVNGVYGDVELELVQKSGGQSEKPSPATSTSPQSSKQDDASAPKPDTITEINSLLGGEIVNLT